MNPSYFTIHTADIADRVWSSESVIAYRDPGVLYELIWLSMLAEGLIIIINERNNTTLGRINFICFLLIFHICANIFTPQGIAKEFEQDTPL